MVYSLKIIFSTLCNSGLINVMIFENCNLNRILNHYLKVYSVWICYLRVKYLFCIIICTHCLFTLYGRDPKGYTFWTPPRKVTKFTLALHNTYSKPVRWPPKSALLFLCVCPQVLSSSSWWKVKCNENNINTNVIFVNSKDTTGIEPFCL